MTLVGAGYRPELPGLFHGEQRVVDCAELVADRYFGETGFARAWELRHLAGVPTIAHGAKANDRKDNEKGTNKKDIEK